MNDVTKTYREGANNFLMRVHGPYFGGPGQKYLEICVTSFIKDSKLKCIFHWLSLYVQLNAYEFSLLKIVFLFRTFDPLLLKI